MMNTILSEIITALRKGEVKKSLELGRTWLADAKPGDPERVLARCPTAMRAKLALLFRDLMSRYPATILGAPVLLYCTPEGEPDTPAVASISLPQPTDVVRYPCADVEFLGWLPRDTLLPLALPFRPETYNSVVPTTQIQACVALFRSHPDVFDLDTIELPHMWWGELFIPVMGSVQFSSRLLLPYPDAIEAARVLHASARGEVRPDRVGFLSDSGWAWACDAGTLFHESCRRSFPSHLM